MYIYNFSCVELWSETSCEDSAKLGQWHYFGFFVSNFSTRTPCVFSVVTEFLLSLILSPLNEWVLRAAGACKPKGDFRWLHLPTFSILYILSAERLGTYLLLWIIHNIQQSHVAACGSLEKILMRMKNHARISRTLEKKASIDKLCSPQRLLFFFFQRRSFSFLRLLRTILPKINIYVPRTISWNKWKWSISVFGWRRRQHEIRCHSMRTNQFSPKVLNFRSHRTLFFVCRFFFLSRLRCWILVIVESMTIYSAGSSAISIGLIFHQFERVTLKAFRRDNIELSCPRYIKKSAPPTIQSMCTHFVSGANCHIYYLFADRKLNENRNHSAFWPIGLVSHRFDQQHFIGANLLTHSQYVFPFIAIIGWALRAIDIIFYSGVETSNLFYLFCLFATHVIPLIYV